MDNKRRWHKRLGQVLTIHKKNGCYEISMNIILRPDAWSKTQNVKLKITDELMEKHPLKYGDIIIFSVEKDGRKAKYIFDIKDIVWDEYGVTVEKETQESITTYCVYYKI